MQKIRENYLLLIALLLLAITGVVFKFKNNTGTLRDTAEFAVEDTASIDKIFMVDKSEGKVVLTRKGNSWVLNDKYPARQDMVNILLTTIKKLTVKAPVPKNTIPNLLKGMATTARKVEIYSAGQNIKTYYVAGPDMNHAGTYMLLDNSTTPYLTHIEGFQGYLTPRYSTDETAWRDKLLFSINKKDITAITIQHSSSSKTPSYTFKNTNGKYSLTNTSANKVVDYDTLALNMWLNSFKIASVENFDAGCSKAKTDSVLNTLPLYELSIQHSTNQTTVIKTFKIKLPPGSVDYGGNPTEYDNDRAYALINNKLPLATVQYAILDNFIKPLNYFTPIVKK